ncbi:MAG: DUF4160 domain-containing protein [Alphaproteobacteria bacterium]
MPTILREDGRRFYFYSHEPNEPAHVHVDTGTGSAKIWLTPVSVAGSVALSSHELADLVRVVRRHREHFMEAWYGHFGSKG